MDFIYLTEQLRSHKEERDPVVLLPYAYTTTERVSETPPLAPSIQRLGRRVLLIGPRSPKFY